MADDFILGLDAFVRSIRINRATSHSLLLGAGASISSGLPSAESCIWEWKRAIFLTNNPGLETQFSELSLPSVKSRIQGWLDAQRQFPKPGAAEEYSFYIERCFPIADDRRAYFQEKITAATPHIGYRLAIKLAEAGIFQRVWSPNFDGLTARAAAQSNSITAIEVGIDCQERLPRKQKRSELTCIYLHGDYRYDALKNTEDELKEQERLLEEAIVAELKDTPLIVVGYSGRDKSLMSALKKSYSQAGAGSLYWCGYGDNDIPSNVRELLEVANSHKRAAYYIQSGGFDDLMLRVGLHCLSGAAVDEARQLMEANAPTPTEAKVDFALPDMPACGVIRSNAYPLTPPSEIHEFDLKECPKRARSGNILMTAQREGQSSPHLYVARICIRDN